ncbi:MAG: hypothetical protein WCT02_03080 [Candidatus Paceibacterota bacterium]
MLPQTLSNEALAVIDQYLHFRAETSLLPDGSPASPNECSIPYFNNRTTKARIALRAYIGKGSPEDIRDELNILLIKGKINIKELDGTTLKKILVDNNLGIECSGFAYHVLNAESRKRGFGDISKNLSFVRCQGLLGKIICSFRPAENCDVITFASEENSRLVALNEIEPGDIITMENDSAESERNHVLVIVSVNPKENGQMKINYAHAVSYPEDGLYGSSVRQGSIEIKPADKSITDGLWTEEDRQGENNRLFQRALKSKTEVRRLRWF